MFLVQMKSAALVAILAWGAVLVLPGRACAQPDRPPGLKGYALVQWMDEHRTRSSPSARTQASRTYVYPRSYAALPQRFAYAQPYQGYVQSYTFAPPSAPSAVWISPVPLRSCRGR